MSAIAVECLLTHWRCASCDHTDIYTITRCYGKRVTVFVVAIATGDSLKYKLSVYGSFVWEIHVRHNKILCLSPYRVKSGKFGHTACRQKNFFEREFVRNYPFSFSFFFHFFSLTLSRGLFGHMSFCHFFSAGGTPDNTGEVSWSARLSIAAK